MTQTLPHPPRYRYLRRYAALAFSVLILLILLRLLWGHLAARLVEADLASLRAQHEPVTLKDFDRTPPIPAHLNAATLLTQAGGLLAYTTVQDQWEPSFNNRLPLTTYDRLVISSLQRANQTPLQLVRQARTTRDRVDWRSPSGGANRSFRNDRKLASLLRYAALNDHARGGGDDAACLNTVLDLTFLSRALAEKYPVVITHFVSLGVDATATDVLEQITPDLPVTPETRPLIARLISELLDDAPLRDSLARGLRGERIEAPFEAKRMIRIAMPEPIYRTFSPMFELDYRRLAASDTLAINAASAPDLPTARRGLPKPRDYGPFRPADITRFASYIAEPAFDRFFEVSYEHLADRHAVATLLAIRLYQADHAGQLPKSLEHLVPAYLPALPIDPLATNNAPLHYDPDKRILYSVGTNGNDDRGSEKPLNVNVKRDTRYRCLDAVYPLDRRPPPEDDDDPSDY